MNKLEQEVLFCAYAEKVLAVKEIGIVEIKEQAGIDSNELCSISRVWESFLKNIILWNSKPTTDQVDTIIFVDKEDKEDTKAALRIF